MKKTCPVNSSWLKNDERTVSVDIVCSVYNHGDYIAQALEGMLAQRTNFPVRIIIHDDASTDQSANIIRAYMSKYPEKILAILEKQNLYQNGKSIGRVMIPYYTAKYLAFCEGDDYWTDKDKLQIQVDYLEHNPDCSAVYHNILPVNKYGEYDETLRGIYPKLEEGDYTKREIRSFQLKTQNGSQVMRNYYPWMNDTQKEFIFQSRINGDAKKLIICGLLGRVHYLPNVMAAHRRVMDGGDSWTARQMRKSNVDRFIESEKRYIELCRYYEFFSGKARYPYNDMINSFISFWKESKNDISNENKKRFKEIRIPFYAWIVYIPCFTKRSIQYIIKKLFRIN